MKIGDTVFSINTEFHCKYLPEHTIRVTAISELTDALSVEITGPHGHRWTEDDWSLTHTVWGFERKEYSFEPYPPKPVLA